MGTLLIIAGCVVVRGPWDAGPKREERDERLKKSSRGIMRDVPVCSLGIACVVYVSVVNKYFLDEKCCDEGFHTRRDGVRMPRKTALG